MTISAQFCDVDGAGLIPVVVTGYVTRTNCLVKKCHGYLHDLKMIQSLCYAAYPCNGPPASGKTFLLVMQQVGDGFHHYLDPLLVSHGLGHGTGTVDHQDGGFRFSVAQAEPGAALECF
jgi:hypothetical protein